MYQTKNNPALRLLFENKLFNFDRLDRTGIRRVLRAIRGFLADRLGLSRIVQFKGFRAKRHAGAAADTGISVNGNGHNIFDLIINTT